MPVYLNLTSSVTFSLYKSFIYASLLLISKGYYTIRTNLGRSEIIYLTIIMGGVFFVYTTYLMESTKLLYFIIVMLFCLLILITR